MHENFYPIPCVFFLTGHTWVVLLLYTLSKQKSFSKEPYCIQMFIQFYPLLSTTVCNPTVLEPFSANCLRSRELILLTSISVLYGQSLQHGKFPSLPVAKYPFFLPILVKIYNLSCLLPYKSIDYFSVHILHQHFVTLEKQ